MPAFQLTWTPSRLHTEQIVAQKMQYQPCGTFLYHISKATIPMPETFLLTQHLVVSSRSNWLKSSLNMDTGTCDWVLDFLTQRQQTVRVGSHTSNHSVHRFTPGLYLEPLTVHPFNSHLCTSTWLIHVLLHTSKMLVDR